MLSGANVVSYKMSVCFYQEASIQYCFDLAWFKSHKRRFGGHAGASDHAP